jgi:hypothetical protein
LFPESIGAETIISFAGPALIGATIAHKEVTWGQCYKTFCGSNLQIFVKSNIILPRQAFLAQSNVCV